MEFVDEAPRSQLTGQIEPVIFHLPPSSHALPSGIGVQESINIDPTQLIAGLDFLPTLQDPDSINTGLLNQGSPERKIPSQRSSYPEID